jgi:hypothetical protein
VLPAELRSEAHAMQVADELRGTIDRVQDVVTRWREQDAHDWPPPHPALILNVPQHERPRPPSPNAVSGVPNILMLGCPYAHAEYIGALLADALGYGYIDSLYSLPLTLDRSPADPHVTESRACFVRTWRATSPPADGTYGP